MPTLDELLELLREAMTIHDEEQFRNAIAHILFLFEDFPEVSI